MRWKLILSVLTFFLSPLAYSEIVNSGTTFCATPPPFPYSIPSSLPTSVPMPCDTAIQAYSQGQDSLQQTLQCAALYDKCDGGTPGVVPGVVDDTLDKIIRQIVKTRIHNLYLGFDGLARPEKSTDPKWLRGQDILKNTPGYGSCAEVGACNPFCDEGGNSSAPASRISFNMNAVLAAPSPLPSPQLGAYGIVPNQKSRLYSGLSGNFIDQNHWNVQLQDFWAKGVLTAADGTALSGSTPPISTPLPTPSSPTDGAGWPIQRFPTSTDKLPSSCQSDPPRDQNSFGTHEAYHTTTIGQLAMEDYKFHTFTWNDDSFPLKGDTSCDMSYSADFSTASTMAALQTGALVQATWMALDEVYNELKNKHFLRITDQKCGAFAWSYLLDLQNTSNKLCKTTSSCTISLESIKSGCTGSLNNQSDCYKSSLINTLHSNFPIVASCEVMARAEAQFDAAFNTGPNAPLWMSQLKNYAVTGCMQSAGDLFSRAPNINKSACSAIWAASCSVAGVLTLGAGLGPCIVAAILALKPADKCLTDTSSTTLDKSISSVWGGKMMGNCFPYAYSAAFKAYLTKMGWHTVPIQGTQFKSSRMVNGKPILEINHCQMTDREGSTSPTTASGLTLFFFSRRSSRKKRKLHSSWSKWSYWFYSFFTFFICTLVLTVGAPFSYGSPKLNQLRMLGMSQNYCVGKNGIILTGKQAQECCTYTSPKTSAGTPNQTSVSAPCPNNSGVWSDFPKLAASNFNASKDLADLVERTSSINNNTDASSVETPKPSLGNGGQSSGATASNQITPNAATPTLSPEAQGGGTILGAARKVGSSAGRGPSSGNLSNPTDSTGPTGSTPIRSPESSLETEVAGATLSGGGSGGSAGRSGGRFNSSVSGQGGTTGSAQFGENANPNSPPQLVEDPEDYFTRINLEDSLFKVIHARYEVKAREWMKSVALPLKN